VLERACGACSACGRCSEPACGDGPRDDDDDDDVMTSGNSYRRLSRYTMIRRLPGPCQGLDTGRMPGAMATYLARRPSGTTMAVDAMPEVHGKHGREWDA